MCSFFCRECSLTQSSRSLQDSAWRQHVLRTCGNSDNDYELWTNLLSIHYTLYDYLLSAVGWPTIRHYTIFDIGLYYTTTRLRDYTTIRNSRMRSQWQAYCLLQGIPWRHGHTTQPYNLELFTSENNWKRNGNPRAACCLVTRALLSLVQHMESCRWANETKSASNHPHQAATTCNSVIINENCTGKTWDVETFCNSSRNLPGKVTASCRWVQSGWTDL